MTDLATSLDAALAELATDPIGVLRASGALGLRSDSCNCPVARFVSKRVGFGVDVNLLGVRPSGRWEPRRRLPERLKQTLREIDAGLHPELVLDIERRPLGERVGAALRRAWRWVKEVANV